MRIQVSIPNYKSIHLTLNVRIFMIIEVELGFYNNCIISRALIGSFLSSIRVQTDKILIYASFQVQLLAVKLSTFWPMRFWEREELLTKFASFWIKFTYLCLRRLFPSFIHGIWPFWGPVIVFNKLTSVFDASILLLVINFVIKLTKFTAEPLACGS